MTRELSWKQAAKDWKATAHDFEQALDEAVAEIKRLTAEPYVVRISRREFMELPIVMRRAIMERQASISEDRTPNEDTAHESDTEAGLYAIRLTTHELRED